MTNLYRYATLEELADALAPLLADRLVSDALAVGNDAEELPPEPAEDDPWAEPAPARQERRSQPRQEPRSGNRGSGSRSQSSGRQSGGNGQRSGTVTDDVGKRWTFGRADAPDCYGNDNHDPEPAALVQGKGRNGKTYKAWACPLGFGDTWRDKCDMFAFDTGRG